MKTTLAALLLAGLAVPVLAQTYVQPHVTKNGAYVQGHMRSDPDSSRVNNYGSQGNYNPYTGAQGTVNPYTPPPQPQYNPPTYGQPQQPRRARPAF